MFQVFVSQSDLSCFLPTHAAEHPSPQLAQCIVIPVAMVLESLQSCGKNLAGLLWSVWVVSSEGRKLNYYRHPKTA